MIERKEKHPKIKHEMRKKDACFNLKKVFDLFFFQRFSKFN